MPGSSKAEFYFIAAMMVLIIIVCVVAVYAFFKTYKKEMREREERHTKAAETPDPLPASNDQGAGRRRN